MSPKYEYWKSQYMINGVSIETLNRLVGAGKLTREEVDGMVAERLENYGY